jgi:hypothetical protein
MWTCVPDSLEWSKIPPSPSLNVTLYVYFSFDESFASNYSFPSDVRSTCISASADYWIFFPRDSISWTIRAVCVHLIPWSLAGDHIFVVLDLVSQIRDVVLARRIFSSGKPQGVGILEWGDQFTSNLGPRWTGSYQIKEGFQVSKGEWKKGKGGSEKGSKKQGDCAIILLSIYMHIHNNCLQLTECWM